ncbi:MAG: ACT domain-containing protein [Acidobacteriota bacterium]|nr:ACT domain-containing protein [Acidobacteriota bacterium]
MKKSLEILSSAFWVARLPPEAPTPEPPRGCELWSVTRTATELSILCAGTDVPDGAQRHGPLSGMRIAGVLDFELVGVLESLLAPLRRAGISVLASSTFDTDYVFVAVREADAARTVLENDGWRFVPGS